MRKNEKDFQYDDVEDVSIFDTDLINRDPESVEGWEKDSNGEVCGETTVEARYSIKTEDDRFDAPYQNGWVTGGSVYKCVDEVRLFLNDKDITDLVSDKRIEEIKEKLNEDIDQEGE